MIWCIDSLISQTSNPSHSFQHVRPWSCTFITEPFNTFADIQKSSGHALGSNFGNRNSSHSYQFARIQKQNVIHQGWVFSLHINDKMQFMLTTIIQLLTLCWQPTCMKFSIIWSQNTAHHKLHILITLQFSVTHTSTTVEMGTFWGYWMKTDE